MLWQAWSHERYEGKRVQVRPVCGRLHCEYAVGPPMIDVLEPRRLQDWAFGKRSPLGWLLLLVIILLILAIMVMMNTGSK